MERLYIFAIGGTGARVMRALTMIMAAGELANYEVVPMLIDYDVANGNLDQTLDLMGKYKIIHRQGLCSHDSGMFCSSLVSIGDIGHNIGYHFAIHLPTLHNDMCVGELVDYYSLIGNEYPFKLLLDSLFYGGIYQNFCVGFKGNAKIARLGYAAMKIQDTIEFRTFLNNVVPNTDKVIVVGSTFGGMGSVGIIEILKQLKHCHLIPINNIATVLVDPYFLPSPNSVHGDYDMEFKKRSRHFHKFYNESGVAKVANTTYRIGMNGGRIIKNSEGGTSQKNIAHPIELLSAMVICEYAMTGQEGLFEYYLGHNNLQFGHESIGLNDFYHMPGGIRLFELLTRFLFSAKFYKEFQSGNQKITNSYFYREIRHRAEIDRSFSVTLERVFSDFQNWTEELSNNTKNKYWLEIFNTRASMSEIVLGHPYNQHGGFFALFSHDILYDFIKHMNDTFHSMRHEVWFNNTSSEQIFIKLLSESSRSIYQHLNI